MLAANRVSHSYGPVRALEDVDFHVLPGEVVALAGENGSGKSTLARILSGGLVPSAGELSVDGDTCILGRPRDAIDHGIVLVPQEPMMMPDLTVAENVLIGRIPANGEVYRRGEFFEAAAPYLERIGLDIDPRWLVSRLNVDQRAMLSVARALAADPRFVILDETTSRLNEADVDRLFELVLDWCASGVGIILITHRLREIKELAGRAVVLRDGRKVSELEKHELSEETIATAMVGRKFESMFGARTQAPGEVLLRVEDLVVEGTESPISFEVRAGEVLGIAGLVGSGRTEIVETIGGARSPESGRVLVGGEPIVTGSPAGAAAAGVSLVPEDRHAQGLFLETSICSNIAVGSWGKGIVRRSTERRAAEEMVERLKIRAPSIDARADSLSGGNQQKVVLARCLARRPRVLLLDEPTRGIDVGAKRELFEVIEEMLSKGAAVVMVSSEMLEVIGMCDRVLVLHEREVAGELQEEKIAEENIALLGGGGSLDR